MRLPSLRMFAASDPPKSRLLLSKSSSHDDFCKRISKTLYYGKEYKQDKGSLPLTSLAVSLFCKYETERTLDKLSLDRAAAISREACISPCSLILAILYLERLAINNPEYLTKVSSSRLFLISVMVATKFMNDEGVEDEVFNDEWAVSSGLDVSELNELEREFLGAIDWSLFVHSDCFDMFRGRIERAVALQQSALNGFLTYGDLDTLSDDALLESSWNVLAENVLKVAAVSLTAYAASVFTLVGSALLVGRLPLAINETSASIWTPSSSDMITPIISLPGQLDSNFDELPPLDSTLPDSFYGLGRDSFVRANSTMDSVGGFWDLLRNFEAEVVDPSLFRYKDVGDIPAVLEYKDQTAGWAKLLAFPVLKA